MKKFVLGTLAMTLLMSSGAFAQRFDSTPRDRYDRHERSDDREFRREERWHVGGTVPYQYRVGGKFVHEDWAGVGLRRPPRGHSWLKIGARFILADDRSGRILDVESARGRQAVWTRGGVVPYDLRVGGKHVHYDWRGVGLRRPPDGFAWMRLGQAYVLANQRSGKILDVEPVRRYDRFDGHTGRRR